MSDNSIRPVRVMHLVSSEGVTGAAQHTLFMPIVTRMPKARVKMLVVSLSPNAVPGPVLRQNGVPVYDVPLSRQRFAFGAFGQLLKTLRTFKPDVIHAWGHTAQIVSHWLRDRAENETKLIWTAVNTQPLSKRAGLIDRRKLQYAAKFSKHADRVVYTSEAGASAHRRAGFPEKDHAVIPLGVDPTRFKPDPKVRLRVRDQLGIDRDAFVIGMVAPFQPEFDHATFIKATGEIIKTNPKVFVLLAGHGVQKGNAALMALVGGGTLGTRTQLLGEWSDLATFFNACDLACSSALTDSGRMSLVAAMLCGVPCVATGMGAQGEVLGQHGVAVEPGNPVALARGIGRVLQMPLDKRGFLVQGARKHALTEFASIRSLQKYLQLYYDLVGRKLSAATSVPAPAVDVTIPVPAPVDSPPSPSEKQASSRSVSLSDLTDPDSLEGRDAPAKPTAPADGDVLHLFEKKIATQSSKAVTPMSERARGVAEDLGDLLAPEVLHGGSATSTPSDASSSPAAVAPETVTTTPAAIEPPVASAAAVASTPDTSAVPPVAPEAQVNRATPSIATIAEEVSPTTQTTTNAESQPASSIAAVVTENKSTPPIAPAAEDIKPSPAIAPPAPAASAAPVQVESDSSFGDTTITVSMKINLDATGTLEIPPELIFTRVVTPAKAPPVEPSVAAQSAPPVEQKTTDAPPVAQATPAASATTESTASSNESVVVDSSAVPESVQTVEPAVGVQTTDTSPETPVAKAVPEIEPAVIATSAEMSSVSATADASSEPAPAPSAESPVEATEPPPQALSSTVASAVEPSSSSADAAANTKMSLPADSSTVPALAVDALLSASTEAPDDASQGEPEALQLDLLADTASERKIAGS